MMEKTDTTRSPLLQPVIKRSYTSGLTLDDKGSVTKVNDKGEDAGAVIPEGGNAPAGSSPQAGQAGAAPGGGATEPRPGARYNIPDDTKEFTFNDDIPEGGPGDVSGEDHGEGIGISAQSAKTFANFIGDAIQIYVPKVAYGVCKVDIENIIMNVNKGVLTIEWIDVFKGVNSRTEEALKISDDEIKMWKKAFKDYLEYKNIKIANPETAFWGATAVLVANLGLKTYQARQANIELVRQAIMHCRPDLFIKKEETKKPDENEGAERTAA
jgi:hypothetical protein